MYRLTSAIAAVLAALPFTVNTTPVLAQAAPPLNTQVQVSYVPPSNRTYQPIYERLKARKALEELAQFLGALRLPQKLTIKTDQCGATTVAFKSQGPVTVCYELMDQIEKLAANVDASDRSSMVAGSFIVVALHQLAIGIFDSLQVPVWGRLDDAADRLAAFVMVQFGQDLALRTLESAELLFTASNKTWTGSDFADATSPDSQRWYNYLCMAYGSSPGFYFLAVPDDKGQQILPDERAGRCQDEYQQVREAFDTWIMPYVDPVVLVRIRAGEWLLPSDVK